MADQLDNRPVFTIAMGCNGVWKSALKRENNDLLPSRCFDLGSIAGGTGDRNSEDARRRTAMVAEAEVRNAIAERVRYGTEGAYAGRPGRERVEQAKRAGYRIEGGVNKPCQTTREPAVAFPPASAWPPPRC